MPIPVIENSSTKSRPFGSVLSHSHGFFEESVDDGETWHREYANIPAVTTDLQGEQLTCSVSNKWPPAPGELNTGGDFFTTKREIIVSKRGNRYSGSRYYSPSLRTRWSTSIFPNYAAFGDPWPESIHSSRDAMNELGASGISRCMPLNPVADAGTSIGELTKDGIPSVPIIKSLKKRAWILKNAGKEFLNVTFGWAPLVDDILKTSEGIARAEEILQQVIRDNGRPIKRNYRFPIDVERSTDVVDNVHPLIGNLQYMPFSPIGPLGQCWRRTVKSREVWFEGVFTYYLDPRIASPGSKERADFIRAKILGLEVNPDTIWNLAPWTWAADWVSNSGDVVHNINAFASNGLIMRRGHVMEKTIHEHTFVHVGPTGYYGEPSVTPVRFRTTTKQRFQADPYGFGVNWDGLSPFQTAVLAALGISKS